MKIVLFLAALLAMALAVQDKYTDKYDNVDIDQVLRSDRLLSNYFRCFMDRGICTPEGIELKRNFPEALTNGCAKCTERQREGSEQIIKFLMEKKPDMWKEVEAKYDPEGIYTQRFLEQTEKHHTPDTTKL